MNQQLCQESQAAEALELARLRHSLAELRELFTSSCGRLGAICAALGMPADEPAEKLAAQARRLVETRRDLLEAADRTCDCAAPSGTGHWFILNNELTALQAQVDRCRAKLPERQTNTV